MRTSRLLLTAPFLVLFVLQDGYSRPPARENVSGNSPRVYDRRICTCDAIRAGGVGWCGRHSRGHAYGHPVRTWVLLEPLLPMDNPDATACTPDAGRNLAGRHGSALSAAFGSEGASAKHCWYGSDVVFPDEESTLAMVNALLTAEHASDHRLTAVPGYCDICRLYHVKGRTYRSWVVAAMEAGERLPGLRAVEAELQPGKSPTSRPAAPGGSLHSEVLASTSNAANGPVAVQPERTPQPGCEYCRKAFAAGAVWARPGFPLQPFCEKCGVGVVAGRVFVGRDAYELAKAADAALAYRRLHRCRKCAIGILTACRCDVCVDCKSCHAP